MTQFLTARVTWLEMVERRYQIIPPPSGVRMALMRVENMPVHFYRYLYEQIGKKHHWQARRRLTDDELSALLKSETTFIHILYIDGCPAGIAEMNFSHLPDFVQIEYFGLVPDYQGRGLSKFFFYETLNAAWEKEPTKIKIQTNNLDNPRALQIYQSAGFSPVGFSEEEITAWE